MKHQVFRKMVERAIAGEKEAMEQLLFLCKPLIDHYWCGIKKVDSLFSRIS